MLCFSLIFLAMIPQLDAPKIYMNEGFFDDQESCEVQLIKSAKKLDPKFTFKQGENGITGFYSDTGGNTYYQCVTFYPNPEAICEQSVLDKAFGVLGNCDCTKLNPVKSQQ